jgi:hypothetical protein
MTIAAPRPRLEEVLPVDDAPVTAGRRTLVLELVVAGFAVAIGSFGFHPIFSSWGSFAVPAVLAVVGATLVSVLNRRLGVPTRFALVISVIVAMVFLSYSVLVSTLKAGVIPSRGTFDAIRDGILHGWSRILRDPLPVRDETSALVFSTSVAWTGGHFAAELVQRTRQVVAPALPALGVFIVSVPLTAPVVGTDWSVVAAVLAASMLTLLVRARPERTLSRNHLATTEHDTATALSSRLSVGVPVIAVATILAIGTAALALHGRAPYDPRELRQDELTTASVTDPLAEFKAIRDRTTVKVDVQLRNVAPADVVEAQRLKLLTLDQFDGTRWLSSDRFTTVAGADIAAVPEAEQLGRPVDMMIDIVGVPDSLATWVPTTGEPVSVSLRDVGIDRSTGDLFVASKLNGVTMRLSTRLDAPTTAQIAAANAARGAQYDPDRMLTVTPPAEITTAALEWSAGATTAGDAVLKLQDHLLSEFGYSDAVSGGHSYGRLVRFLTDERAGTAEQFASTLAVMARSLGYPARIVVGYRLTDTKDGAVEPVTALKPEHFHAWVEVALDGLGWVSFDPTPATGAKAPAQPTQRATGTTVPQDGGGDASRAPQETGPIETPPDQSISHGFGRLLVVGLAVLATLALLVAAAVLAIALVKRVRRDRRRRAQEPTDRVVGAWDEVLDRLVEADVVASASLTPAEVCGIATERLGAAATLPLRPLANDVTKALYAYREPSPQIAERAWLRSGEFAQNLDSTRTRWQRWRALADPRPLRRR